MSLSIVAMLTDPGTAHAGLDAAAVVAAVDHGSVIEAFHPRVTPESLILPSEEVMTERRHAELTAMLDDKSNALRQIVDEWNAAHAAGGSAVWGEGEGRRIDAIVAARGKAADLLVLVRPDEADGDAALHAAIFETGRLLLLVPPEGAPGFGRHMAIAWKESDQAARAVTAAIPWLKCAAEVSVLTVGEAEGSPRNDDAAVALLEDQGIKAEALLLERDSGSVAEQLLYKAHSIGADCLVLGAYRHSELREFILGGVTRYMLHGADLPLFMMH